jgi:hypothetical protein
LLCFRCAIAVLSPCYCCVLLLCFRCAITVCYCCAFAVLLLCYCCAFAVLLLCFRRATAVCCCCAFAVLLRCAIAVLSLCYCCASAVLSLCYCCAFAMLLLCYCCATAVCCCCAIVVRYCCGLLLHSICLLGSALALRFLCVQPQTQFKANPRSHPTSLSHLYSTSTLPLYPTLYPTSRADIVREHGGRAAMQGETRSRAYICVEIRIYLLFTPLTCDLYRRLLHDLRYTMSNHISFTPPPFPSNSLCDSCCPQTASSSACSTF